MEQFRKVAVLGKGNFGKVLLVQYLQTKKYYALKALKKHEVIKRQEEDAVESEKRILTVVTEGRHPFTIKLYACFQNTANIFFLLQYAKAGDLLVHVQRDKFTEKRALFCAACVILGIGFLHSRNIAYRDIKLENLLVDEVGYVLIADFGLCKEGMGPTDTTSTICGTPQFIAPEIFLGPYTRVVDWWSIGVLMYELLLGQCPFPGDDDDEELLVNVMNYEVRYPETLSPAAKSILSRLLVRDPQKRLGANGVEEIKAQPVFKNIDFDALLKRKLAPPVRPSLDGGDEDVSNFDEMFTLEHPILTPPPSDDNSHLVGANNSFPDFDFISDIFVR